MLNLLREEKGASLVLTALAMVVLFGFAALALDGGNLYFHHTRLQDIADACALAACNDVVETNGNDNQKKSTASETAFKCAGLNNLNAKTKSGFSRPVIFGADENGEMELSFPDNIKEVKVDIFVYTNLFFARVFGPEFNTTPVKVSATARVPYTNLVPICFFQDINEFDPDDDTGPKDFTLESGQGENGNYGYLDYDDPNMFCWYMENGYNNLIEDKVDTYTGGSVGQVRDAIGARISRCKDNCSWDDFEPDCPLAVIVPIVDRNEFVDSLNGKGPVTVTGFARLFIDSYKNKVLWGYLIGEVSPEEVFREVKPIRLVE